MARTNRRLDFDPADDPADDPAARRGDARAGSGPADDGPGGRLDGAIDPRLTSKPERDEPRMTALICAVLVCGLLIPFDWLVKCRCCWRGRCRTVIGRHQSHLRVLRVCPVCDAVRPVPAWLQPPQRDGNILA
jgi:hypothetical protein